jgi:DENN domain-containing protein 11
VSFCATARYTNGVLIVCRYFIHDGHAGISAFLNEPAPESERNASMLSVGVLVPLEYGRMGKSWLHAEGLKDLARLQSQDIDNTERFEKYWEKHRIQDGERPKKPLVESPLSYRASASNGQPNGPRRSRGMSDTAALTSALRSLSAYHPALSLTGFTKLFGPLIFPLYRAALLRKRILFVGEPPVRQNCEFGKHPGRSNSDTSANHS